MSHSKEIAAIRHLMNIDPTLAAVAHKRKLKAEPVKRVGYREMLNWIAYNDDTNFLEEDDGCDAMSVTAVMLMHLFDKTEEQVRKDLIRAVARARAE
jgi:hypothetical protein